MKGEERLSKPRLKKALDGTFIWHRGGGGVVVVVEYVQMNDSALGRMSPRESGLTGLTVR